MFINKINTFNIQSYFGISNTQSRPVASYPNLAPLDRDTVTFRGIENKFDKSLVKETPKFKDCEAVHDYAAASGYYLYSVLDKYFSDILSFKETKTTKNQLDIKPTREQLDTKNKIGAYEVRIKSGQSIFEKVVSKFGKLYTSEHDDFAEELYQDLIVLFPQNPDISKEQIIDSIKEVTKDSKCAVSSSAYDNAAYTIREIMNNLRAFGYLDFSGSSDDAEETFIKALIEKAHEHSSEISTDDKTFISPASIEGIKYYANDIVGARLVINDFGPDNADKIMSALTKAVSDGALKITSIENIIPDERFLPKKSKLSDFLYVTHKQFRPLEKASKLKAEDKPSKTGYMAIHINVDLADDDLYKLFPVCNGFSGEIQIIGRDVERLKEIEDLCYKLKTNKKIDYPRFTKAFEANYTDENKDAFDEYTYFAYLRQRKVSPRRRGDILPSLQELGFSDKLPKALDFNELKNARDKDKSERPPESTIIQRSYDEVSRNSMALASKRLIDWKIQNL